MAKLLAEFGLFNSKSKIYSKTAHSIREIIQANINDCKKFDLKLQNLINHSQLCTGYLKCIRHPLVPG